MAHTLALQDCIVGVQLSADDGFIIIDIFNPKLFFDLIQEIVRLSFTFRSNIVFLEYASGDQNVIVNFAVDGLQNGWIANHLRAQVLLQQESVEVVLILLPTSGTWKQGGVIDVHNVWLLLRCLSLLGGERCRLCTLPADEVHFGVARHDVDGTHRLLLLGVISCVLWCALLKRMATFLQECIGRDTRVVVELCKAEGIVGFLRILHVGVGRMIALIIGDGFGTPVGLGAFLALEVVCLCFQRLEFLQWIRDHLWCCHFILAL